MYKVTAYRFAIKLWGRFGPERAKELEGYLNSSSPDGYELVIVLPFGFWFMCIWKKK
ncbi:MAG: hypothetical protein HYW86_03180 [Candidatus Roizmanbacteria bacterium]|nr:MAG: hypothetical protein HYW86_03180 [Candidatus Roizmanbacteria bacterium]